MKSEAIAHGRSFLQTEDPSRLHAAGLWSLSVRTVSGLFDDSKPQGVNLRNETPVGTRGSGMAAARLLDWRGLVARSITSSTLAYILVGHHTSWAHRLVVGGITVIDLIWRTDEYPGAWLSWASSTLHHSTDPPRLPCTLVRSMGTFRFHEEILSRPKNR